MKTMGSNGEAGVMDIESKALPKHQDEATPQAESGVQSKKVIEAVDRLLVHMLPLADIAFARRSKGHTDEIEVFNPRDEEDFTHWSMEDLEKSIAEDGLFQFPNVRLVQKGTKQTYQLLAGERRIRAITNLVKRNAQVYDEATDKLYPASALYATVPCRVVKHVDDMKALRIAVQENGQQRQVSEKSLVFLCEYMLDKEAPGKDRKYTRKEVAAGLGKSESWLCQTLSFKAKLDPKILDQLFEGKITRSYAIDLMSYDEEDRGVVNEAAHLVASERFESTLERAEAEQAEAEVCLEQAVELETQAPTDKKAATAAAKVERAKKKVEKAAAKVQQIETQGVQVQQSDLAAGAIEIGVQPLGVKGLSTKQLHDRWLDRLDQHLSVEKVRQVKTGRVYPRRDILLVRAVAKAIADGVSEPLEALDVFYKSQGGWGMFGTDGFNGKLDEAVAAFNKTPVAVDEDIDEDEIDDDLDLDEDLDEIDDIIMGDLDDDEGEEEEGDE